MKPNIGNTFHLLVVLYYIYFDKFLFTVLIYDVFEASETFGNGYLYIVPQFATVWSQFLVQDYFFLSLIEDVLDCTPSSFCVRFKRILGDHVNNLFVCYAFPIAIVMTVNFWLLFYDDPGNLDEYNLMFHVFDRETNHVVHTYVIAILLVEMCVKYRYYPSSLTVATPYKKMGYAFGAYYATVFCMKLFSPLWPYPYFKAMSLLHWIAYIVANLLLSWLCYAFGYMCNLVVWDKHPNVGGQCHSNSRSTKAVKSLTSKLLRLVQVIEG